jgi:hypothetical protein
MPAIKMDQRFQSMLSGGGVALCSEAGAGRIRTDKILSRSLIQWKGPGPGPDCSIQLPEQFGIEADGDLPR